MHNLRSTTFLAALAMLAACQDGPVTAPTAAE
jgi:predicted small lipoprotein YifL